MKVYIVVADVYEGGPRSTRLVKGFINEVDAMQFQRVLDEVLETFRAEQKRMRFGDPQVGSHYEEAQEILKGLGDPYATQLYDLTYEVEELEVD